MERASDYDDFESVLDGAENNAETDRELTFVSDMRDKYDEYGGKCFVSDAQYNMLCTIADRESC